MDIKIALGAAALILGVAGPAAAQPLGGINGVGDARARNEPSVVGLSSTESAYFRNQPGATVPYGNGYGIPSYYGAGPGFAYGAPQPAYGYGYAEDYAAPRPRGRITVYNEGRSFYRPAPRLVERRAYAPRRVRHIRVYRPFS